ncbi:MAG: beta-L-arabinofuranosidase domain-containing protein, partial [Tepidisphaeraceae bacterium]
MSIVSMMVIPHASAQQTPAQPITNVIPYVARPLPLSAVRLTSGPLKNAQDLDAAYLLKLQPDRMLAGYRIRAGLEPKAKGYGGWDSVDGKQLTGHIGGHYLSAVSLMYAATGDVRFIERADYIVNELKEVQDKQGDGYLGALANGKERFAEVARGDIRSGGFDLNGLWSPWYVLHKTYAGLRDACRFTGNRTALELEIKFAGWAEGVLSKLNDDQIQKMLGTEFGGMNEVLADLYADTGDKRWLALSDRFQHRAIVDPLSRREDILGGKHGNTQVPKLLGSLARYIYTGSETDGAAARFFWDQVVDHHSFATGGHGKDEYFGPPGKLDAMVDGRTAETCNVYNMLKMTRQLFAIKPDVRYAEFHERALFNHVLASFDPQDGWACYMVPVGRGVTREYERNMLDGGFTCCVGSSMESHALHGDGIYYESADRLWVNLYVSSTAQWKAAGVNLAIETTFPEGESATLKLSLQSSREFTLALRRPMWAGDGFGVKVNDEAVKDLPKPGSYVELKRNWKSGDTVSLVLPKTLRTEPLPDNPNRVALMWGPLVLAGDLEPAQRAERKPGSRSDKAPVPVFVATGLPVAQWLKPVVDKPGSFRTYGVGRDRDVDFVPFYRLHRRMYAVYWDLFTPEGWAKKAAEYAAEREQQGKLEAATVAFVQPGEMQP